MVGGCAGAHRNHCANTTRGAPRKASPLCIYRARKAKPASAARIHGRLGDASALKPSLLDQGMPSSADRSVNRSPKRADVQLQVPLHEHHLGTGDIVLTVLLADNVPLIAGVYGLSCHTGVADLFGHL